MIILNSTYTLLYPRLEHLRRKIVENEDMLLNDFMPYEIHPVPDNAPPEIPRITMKTKNEYSLLLISLTGAAIQTFYDDNYNRDWGKCKAYFDNKTKQTFNVIHQLLPKRVETQSIKVQILMDVINEPVLFLREKITTFDPTMDIRDIGCNAT